MTIPATHAARISQHVYDNPDDPVPFELDAVLTVDERAYKIVMILDEKDTGLSGYQGAIYQDQATGELIVAHRGTETELVTPLALDAAADAQMTVTRVNMQTPYSEVLTREAMRMAKDPEQWPFGVTSEPPVSHTGHSLGGYHAEHEASKHGHAGASFNAFGAAGIGNAPAGIVDGAPPFSAHVRATDVVALASRHFGDVVSYATTDDLAMISNAQRRPGIEGPAGLVANIAADAGARHSISSFVEGGLMTSENRNRYLDFQPQFAEHQRAVHSGREWATFAGDAAERYVEVNATVYSATPGNPLARAAIGTAAGINAVNAMAPPATPGFLERTATDVDRAGLGVMSAVRDTQANLLEARAEAAAVLSSGATSVGVGAEQTVGSLASHIDAGVKAHATFTASAYRGVGQTVQDAAELPARALDAIGLDGAAELLRRQALDARTAAEAAAQSAEQDARRVRTTVDDARVGIQNTIQGALQRVTAPLDAHATEDRGAAARHRDEAVDIGRDSADMPERLHAAAAPNLDMRATAREKIRALYAEHDRPMPSPEQLDRMSAAVVADARGQGMNRIEAVMFSQGKGNGPNFEGNLIAFDRDPMNELSRHSATPIGKAQETPVEHSVERTRAANERQEQFQLEQQQMQARDQAMTESQGMSMRIGARTMEACGGEGAAAGGDGGGG